MESPLKAGRIEIVNVKNQRLPAEVVWALPRGYPHTLSSVGGR